MVIAGRYELARRIADGGMASVWEARDTVLDRTVAVKVVDVAADDPTLGERLQREAVAAAALSHPDVVTVHDAGVEDGTAYVVMALVPGQDLGRVVAERGPLAVGEAVRIGTRVADALAAAHAAGIVHRDVKPGNVMVVGDRVTVVDFGIASVEGAQASLTAAGTVVGTADSMAPEQASGGPTTPATDVYALGCLLTTLLTGSPPFAAQTPLAVLQRHVADPPPAPSSRREDVPPELDALVLRMLAKDPAARPSAAEVRDALASLPGPAAAPDAAPTAVVPPVAPTRVLPVPETAPGPATTPSTMPAAVPPAAAPARGTRPTRSTRPAPPPSRLPPPIPPRWPRERRRGPGWLPIGVLSALAVLAVIALAGAIADDAPGDTSASATAPAPTEAEPAAPPAEPPAPTDAAGLLAVLATTDAELARQLGDRWAEVTRVLAEGDAEKAAEKLRDLLARVDTAEGEGRLDPATAEALRTAFLAESGIAPAAPEDEGERGGGNGNGNGRGRGGKGGDD